MDVFLVVDDEDHPIAAFSKKALAKSWISGSLSARPSSKHSITRMVVDDQVDARVITEWSTTVNVETGQLMREVYPYTSFGAAFKSRVSEVGEFSRLYKCKAANVVSGISAQHCIKVARDVAAKWRKNQAESVKVEVQEKPEFV